MTSKSLGPLQRRFQFWRGAAAISPKRLDRIRTVLFLAGLAVGLLILASSSLGSLYQVDATFFYVAGRMWLEGLDPYGPQFAIQAQAQGLSPQSVWVYPPQWWSVAAGLALFPPQRAFLIWKVANLLLLGGGAILTWLAADGPRRGTTAFALIGFVLFLCCSDATNYGLYLGQTNFLVLFGLGALMCGLRWRSAALSSLGLVLLLLKPQFGLLFAGVALSRRDLRRPVAFALGVTGLLSLPLVLSSGIGGFAQSMLRLIHNLSAYSTLMWNRPLELSGLDFFAALIGAPETSALLYVALGIVLCLIALRRREAVEDFWIVTVATAVFILPLHGYDFLVAATLLLLIQRFRRWAALCVCLGLAVVFRPIDFAEPIARSAIGHGAVSPGTIAYMTSYTIAGLLVFAAGLFGRLDGRRYTARAAT